MVCLFIKTVCSRSAVHRVLIKDMNKYEDNVDLLTSNDNVQASTFIQYICKFSKNIQYF